MDKTLETAEKNIKTDISSNARSGAMQKLPISLRFEQWTYHIANNKLCSGKVSHALTPIQSRLLQFFCEHQGQIFTRKQLVESVWQDKVVGHKTVDMAIALLRKTLGDDSKNPHYIETVKSQGYRFLPEVSYDYAEKKGLLANTSYKLTTSVIAALTVFILFFAGFTYYLFGENSGIQVNTTDPKPITSLKGKEIYGSYNANANVMVFSHQAPQDGTGSLSLMAKSLAQSGYAQLTDTGSTKSGDYYAEISPLGNRIVFNRANLTTQCDYMLADFDAVKLSLSNIIPLMPCPKGTAGHEISWKDEDNLYLSYKRKRESPLALYRMEIKTRELFPLTDVEHIKGHGDYSFSYSKQSHKIAYLRNITGVNGTELWVLDLGNNTHKKLTTVNSLPFSVAWVNQGNHLIVRTAHSELSIVDMEGVVSVIEDNTKSPVYNPFSINDTQIVFMVGEYSIHDVYIADLNKNSIDTSLSSSFSDFRPAMAKSSETMAFVSKRDGLYQVWSSNKVGMFQFTHLQSSVVIQSLALSPNGEFLAYDADWGVVLLDKTGKELYINKESSSNPTFSLDGKYLYFQTKDERISRLDIKTMKLTPSITRGAVPKAGENGSLYFIRDRHLFKLSVVGGITELMPLSEFSQIWKSSQYDVIDGQFYYAKQIDGGFQLVKRPLSGGEETVVRELFVRDFSLNSDATLMISSRVVGGETNLETIDLTSP